MELKIVSAIISWPIKSLNTLGLYFNARIFDLLLFFIQGDQTTRFQKFVLLFLHPDTLNISKSPEWPPNYYINIKLNSTSVES